MWAHLHSTGSPNRQGCFIGFYRGRVSTGPPGWCSAPTPALSPGLRVCVHGLSLPCWVEMLNTVLLHVVPCSPGSCSVRHSSSSLGTLIPYVVHKAPYRQLEKKKKKAQIRGCVCAQLLSHAWLIATPWTVVRKVPLSVGFSKQENWSALPLPSPGDLPNPGIEPTSLAWQVDSLPLFHLINPKKRLDLIT